MTVPTYFLCCYSITCISKLHFFQTIVAYPRSLSKLILCTVFAWSLNSRSWLKNKSRTIPCKTARPRHAKKNYPGPSHKNTMVAPSPPSIKLHWSPLSPHKIQWLLPKQQFFCKCTRRLQPPRDDCAIRVQPL